MLLVVFPILGLSLYEAFKQQAQLSEKQTLRAYSYNLLAAIEIDNASLVNDIQLDAPSFSIPDSGLYALIRDENNLLWHSSSFIPKQALHPGLTGKGLDFKLYVDELRSLAAGASSEIRMNIVTDVEWNQGSATPLLEAMENVNFADGIFSEQLGVQLTVDESNQLSENGTLVSTDSLQLINAFRHIWLNQQHLQQL